MRGMGPMHLTKAETNGGCLFWVR